MKTYFIVDRQEVSAREYSFVKFQKGYIEKITYDNDSNEIRKLEFNEYEYNLKVLRAKRLYILRNGFEPYKTNVQYGIEPESNEQRSLVMSWYRDMLDITKLENAIENIPDCIKYYLGGYNNG